MLILKNKFRGKSNKISNLKLYLTQYVLFSYIFNLGVYLVAFLGFRLKSVQDMFIMKNNEKDGHEDKHMFYPDILMT